MSDYGAYETGAPSPQEVNNFHKNDDCDKSVFAHHHTIGNSPNQAASGKVVADLVKLVADLEARITALETP